MTIFVGNLADEVTDDDLRKAFQNFGQVTAVSITKDSFGESRGVAFVEMPAKTEAQAAINGLNGQELKGRALNVNEARHLHWSHRGSVPRAMPLLGYPDTFAFEHDIKWTYEKKPRQADK